MNLIPDIQNMRELVTALLTKHVRLRDNDLKLIANVWHWEIEKKHPECFYYKDTLRLLAEGELTNPETIRRTRQKVQEEFPDLRGTSYMKRKITGDNVRKNIKAA